MDNQKKEENGREGRLPAMAPLANPYVPFQLENPPQYEAQKGLVRGTLFPGLDLPFMGMVNLNELPETPSSQMQALAFAVQELALYLDTHRDDREALFRSSRSRLISPLSAASGKGAGGISEMLWPTEPRHAADIRELPMAG